MDIVSRGIWSGTFATSAMTLFMMKVFENLPKAEQKPLPPAKLTTDIERATLKGDAKTEVGESNTALSMHFAYGVATATTYASLAPKSAANGALKGMAFGSAVWAASYLGWIPAIGFRVSAGKMSLRRNAMMIAAHLIWGAALGYSEEILRTRGTQMWDGRSSQ